MTKPFVRSLWLLSRTWLFYAGHVQFLLALALHDGDLLDRVSELICPEKRKMESQIVLAAPFFEKKSEPLFLLFLFGDTYG